MLRLGYHYAFRNIFRTPLRSFFTVLSIALVISLYTLLTAVAHSFTGQINSIMQQESIDVIVQSKFATTPIASSLAEETVRQINGMEQIASSVSVVVGKRRLEDRTSVFLFGFDHFEQIASTLGLSLKKGRLYHVGKAEVIVAQRLMKNRGMQLGEDFHFPNASSLRSVGTYHSWISFFNQSVICDLEQARAILHKPQKTNMLFITVKNPRQTQKLIEDIQAQYPQLMAVKSSDFSQTLGSIKNIFYLSDIIAMVTLIIASAILMNTFVIAVSERRKEIGILRAMGWRASMIVTIVTLESIFLALIGGVLGFLFSLGMLQYLKTVYLEAVVYLPESLSLLLFGQTLLVAIGIAIVGATVPVGMAIRTSIVKALRDG